MANNHTSTFEIKPLPTNRKRGKIFGSIGRSSNERACAGRMSLFGYDIHFQKESRIAGMHTADVIWEYDNCLWEYKTLYGNSTNNTHRAIHHAATQSNHVVLYLGKTTRSISRVRADVISYFSRTHTHKVKQVLIIDQNQYCIIRSKMIR